jgi:type I restriction enzyme S subunit
MDGQFNIARWSGGKALLNQRVCKITARKGLDIGYLFHYLPLALKRIEDATPFVTVKHLSAQDIRECSIPLPPQEEQQQRIAAILDKADALRQKRRSALQKLDSLTQSIFLDMFGDPAQTGRWPLCRVADIAEFENGDRSSNYPSGYDIKESGILFLNGKNIVNNRLDLSSSVYIDEKKFASLSRGKAKRGDLIITLRGTLGSCFIFDCDTEQAFINAQMMIIRAKESIDRVFLHSLLTSHSMQTEFSRMSSGVAVPQLTASQLKELQIILPPIDLQKKYSALKAKICKTRNNVLESISKCDGIFVSLQHRAFRGEL